MPQQIQQAQMSLYWFQKDFDNKLPLSKIMKSVTALSIVSRVTGFQLFTVDVTKGQARVNLIDFVLIFLSVCMNCIINVTFWISRYNPGIHGIAVMKYSLPILMYFNLLGNMFGMTWIFIHRAKIMKILQLFSEIDAELMKIGERIDHKRNKRNLKILVIVPIFLTTFVTFMCGMFHEVDHFRLDFLLKMFSLWIFVCTFVMYYHLVVGVSGVSQRFEKICKTTMKISPQSEKTLYKIQEIHVKIADAIDIYNKVYGPLMIFYFGDAFCWLCISIFALAMFPNTNRSTICTLVCTVSHCFTTIATSFFIVNLAENVANQRKNLIKNSYKLINTFSDNLDFGTRILHFQSQVMNVKFVFSCGFFDINWKFVFKFFSAGFMYFVILVQFERTIS
ncbi:unnamed protein product [Chironomus riparius]|uniref:Gustatory receptor n=1 Tax=Chironomus riparius TaxID=315576 RepID=A0A9N9S6Q2_9DIPT|nr:unnamed protein product [Chironomus riparius]